MRSRSLLAVVAVLAAVLLPGLAPAGGGPRITVMTQNLYLGTGLNDIFGPASFDDVVSAMSQDWANVVASDIPARAAAVADEIARGRPHVVGLQEVTLWRDQTPSDLRTHPGPNARHVAFDFLAILQQEVSARGVPYTAVAVSTNADVEAPRLGSDGSLVDVRATDRDVIIVRSDVADRIGNPRAGHYTAQYQLPFLTGPVTSTRGWTSIDYRHDAETTVRIVNTHLEIASARDGSIQERQGEEALAIVAASPYPVIVLGDFNSAADGSTTGTYRTLTAVLDDAWTSARPRDPGLSCCQAELLDNPVGREYSRIDLVLSSEDWAVTHVARTGVEPFRAGQAPLWASDHFGVTARLTIPRR